MTIVYANKVHASALRINILICGLIKGLSSWDYPDLSAPYWRLYYNDTSGAFVHYGGVTRPLAPGFITLIAPDISFAGSLQAPVNHLYIHFTLAFPGILQKTGVYQFKVTQHDSDLVRTLCESFDSHKPPYGLELAGHELTAAILRRIPAADWTQTPLDHRIRTAMEIITNSPSSSISNAKLAHAVNMSVNGFIRLFTGCTGVSPRQYGLRVRLDSAAIMLHHTEKSIKSIAEECGFWDRNYFTRMFAKHRCITPGKFRKQQKHYLLQNIAGATRDGPGISTSVL